jgi:hypothetical protein
VAVLDEAVVEEEAPLQRVVVVDEAFQCPS